MITQKYSLNAGIRIILFKEIYQLYVKWTGRMIHLLLNGQESKKKILFAMVTFIQTIESEAE